MFDNYSSNNVRALGDDRIRHTAPSVFADHADANVSSRYTFLPTIRIVEEMRNQGWAVVSAKEQRVRVSERRGFQKHMVKFQRQDSLAVVGEYAPQIVLVNSHDRSSGYQIHAGLYRYVCSNGLMVSDSVFAKISIRHTGFETDEVIKSSFEVLGRVPELTDKVQMFKARRLSPAESVEFARRAILLRYDDIDKAPVSPERLIKPVRSQDAGNDIWSVYNRAQENLIQGGVKDWSKYTPDGKRFGRMRAVASLDADISINKGLWDLAEKFSAGTITVTV